MDLSHYLFQLSPLPMWVADAETFKFEIVNNAAVSTYGYSAEEFLSMTTDELHYDDGILSAECRHITKQGDVIYVQQESSTIDHEGRKVILFTITDITDRVMKERELDLVVNRFKSLVNEGSEMISVLDKDLKFIYLSPASLKFYAAEVEFSAVRALGTLDYVHEDDQARLIAAAAELAHHKNINIAPFRLRNAAGEWRWVETIITNLLDDPAIAGILCNTRDVTERIHNEEKITLNAERFNIISKATSDTIWDWNLHTDTIIWNKGIKGIFGYKNLIDFTTSGDWWKEQIHPDDREKVVNDIHRHISEGITKWESEYRFLCADGSYKFVFDRGFMVFDSTGASVRMIGSMQDISQRKQEEQWSRLLESVVINATDAVQICTGNVEGSGQSIIYVNEAFTKMSGYSKYELIGASPRISQGPETDIREIRKLKNAIENKIPCEIEVINYTKQGKEYWVSQSNAPIADNNGQVTHWISIQRDITQNRRYLKEIEEQNKKFKEIAWIQSHLVRAPLARVMGLVDLLKNFVPGDDSDTLLGYLESSAKELDAIIINIADKTPENGV